MIPVILSGGIGTRLWPLSRKAKPKQFLPLINQHSLLQNTLQRIAGYSKLSAPIVVCNEEHRFLVAEQLRDIGVDSEAILLEPSARNTAAAVALAAIYNLNQARDDLLLVLPSDHVIQDVPAFHRAIKKAEGLAQQNKLVMFGVIPNKPITSYGYIKKGVALNSSDCFSVESFVEKPDQQTAKRYLETGDYFWNAGMFLFKSSRYLKELELYSPEVLKSCKKAIEKSGNDLDFIRVDRNAFMRSPEISIDYAVMEKTNKAVVVSMDANWSDVGEWSAIQDMREADDFGNTSVGDVIFNQCRNSLAYSGSRLLCVVGIENAIVIETADAVLVTNRKMSQAVKDVVLQLKQEKRAEAIEHRQGFRPWGTYDCIDKGRRFQVKRITVKPGQSLSLQVHRHRAEHWVVVSGIAKVRCGDSECLLKENESTYIPIGVIHQLSNPGETNLELIEIQSGAYLGEDDIERFKDEFGRS